MMAEWIRFWIVAILVIIALIGFVLEVLGVWRFGYVMNRMHAAGIGDTFCLFFVAVAMMVESGWNMDSLKLFLVVLFMWFTSPTSTHFLAQIEFYTSPDLTDHLVREDKEQMEKETREALEAQKAEARAEKEAAAKADISADAAGNAVTAAAAGAAQEGRA